MKTRNEKQEEKKYSIVFYNNFLFCYLFGYANRAEILKEIYLFHIQVMFICESLTKLYH